MKLKNTFGVLLVALGVGALWTGCSGGEDAPSSQVTAGSGGVGGASEKGGAGAGGAMFVPCSGSLCSKFENACKQMATVCPELKGKTSDADFSLACAKGLQLKGEANAKADGKTVDTASNDLLNCLMSAKSCGAIMACMKGPTCFEDECGGGGGKGGTGGGTPIPDPNAFVPLPGDDPKCVACASAKCNKEAQHCFLNSESDPACYTATGVGLCCLSYRQCLDGCEAGPDGSLGCIATLCDQGMPVAAAEYAAYAKCMETNCLGCGSAGAGGTGGAGAGGSGPSPTLCGPSTKVAACDQCLAGACCSQLGTCQGAACETFMACVGSCKSPSCVQACTASSGVDSAWAATVLACSADCSECPFVSGAGGAGGTGGGGGPSAGACGIAFTVPGCQACADTSCCAQIDTCAKNPNCQPLITCLGQCNGDPVCLNQCQAALGSGVAPASSLVDCLTTSCPQCKPLDAW